MNHSISSATGTPRYNFRLTIKLVLAVMVVIISAVAILDFFFIPRLSEPKIKKIESMSVSLSQLVSELALASMVNRKPAMIEGSLQRLMSPKDQLDKDILQISVITNPDGVYYASTTKAFVNRKAHNSLLLKLSRNQKDGTSVEIVNYKVGGKTIPALQFLRNIYFHKKGVQHHLATTQILYNYDSIIQETRSRVLTVAGVILLISVLVVWVLLLPISRGHYKLAVGMAEAIDNRFHHRLIPRSKDEISVLYQLYNRLMERVETIMNQRQSDQILDYKNGYQPGTKSNESIIRKSEITCLCSRIPQIQTKIETQQPGEVVDFIRQYLSTMEDTIQENGGQIIKIFGDKVYAVFEGINSPDNAVRASLKLGKKWSGLNHEHKVLGREQLNYGIGIHSELGITGNFDLIYNSYSIVSDVAKVSDYLCTCAPKGEILISSALLEKTTGSYQHQIARGIVFTEIKEEDVFILLPNQDTNDLIADVQTNIHVSANDEGLEDDVKTDKIASALGVQSAKPERTFDSSLPDILEETLAAAPLGDVTEEEKLPSKEGEEESSENLWGEFSDHLKSDD